MLVEDVHSGDICAELGVTPGVVKSIRCCENHLWLKDCNPVEYSIIEQRHNSFDASANNALSRGIIYPTIVDTNTGNEYEVTSVRELSRILKIDSGNLCHILNGDKLSYKGLVLKTNLDKVSPQKLIGPDGVIHIIPYRGLSRFAANVGIAKSILSNILTEKRKEYLGWKKYVNK